eukprot:UN21373
MWVNMSFEHEIQANCKLKKVGKKLVKGVKKLLSREI